MSNELTLTAAANILKAEANKRMGLQLVADALDRIGSLENHEKELSQKIAPLERKVTEIQTQMEQKDDQLAELNKKIKIAESDLQAMGEQQKKLEAIKAEHQDLARKANDAQARLEETNKKIEAKMGALLKLGD